MPGERARVIRRGPTTTKTVALTFDAGADRGEAADLLATLEKAGIHATFGLTGRWAESNPDLVRRLVADGDDMINHSYDHRSFTGLSARPAVLASPDRIAELERTEAIVETLTGATTRPLFRPPYGDEDDGVLRDAARAGYHYAVLWTIDSFGWRGISATQIVERCVRLASPGAIYILHVGSRSHDVEATRSVIDGLRAEGYRFVTVHELLGLDQE